MKDWIKQLPNKSIVRKLIFAIKFFTAKRIMDSASALTYSTMLSLVPICAVVFAIARGFGYTIYIEKWFRNLLSTQPQAAEFIITFVNSYLEHTKSGIILGIGLIFMLYTVVMLSRQVEQTFNNIWHVEDRKNIMRTFTDYLSIFFLTPIVIIVMSGISLFIRTISSQSNVEILLGPVAHTLIDFMPFLLMWIAFTALYVFMPNTHVRLRRAIIPGLLASIAMQLLQWFYINAQMWVSNYNAIYGSFAALPLFMLWVQFSWTICLFGAELCYTNQNLEDFAFVDGASRMSNRNKQLYSIVLMSRICHRFAGGNNPYSAITLSNETSIPLSIVRDLLNMLVKANLITEVKKEDEPLSAYFQPAMSIERLTVGHIIDVMEEQGEQVFTTDLESLIVNKKMYQEIINLRKEYIAKMEVFKFGK